MITVKLFSYPNTVDIQIFDSSIFTTRNREVYSRPIKVYQGIDNPIQIIVKNQDQKKVNLTGYTVQVDIQDYTNNTHIESYTVDFSANVGGNIQMGRGSFTISANTLANLEQRFYKLTTRTISSTDVQRPLYIDDNYSVPLDLEVLPGYLNP